MPDLPITGLTALTTVPDDDFPLAIVDLTDPTQSPQGTTKKVERGVLLGGILPLRVPVKNNSGVSTLTKGTLLMAVGALGDRVLVDPAVTDGSVNAIYIVGVAAEDIGPGADGYAESYAELRNMNTLAYPVGTILWNDPAVPGGVTTVQPTAPNLKIPVAIVTRQNATSGRWFVRETPFPNLGDLSDVEAPAPADGQALAWDGVNNRWEPRTISGDASTETIAQVAHGFAVGDIIRHNGTIYVKAQADTAANAEAIGVVSAVPGPDSFTVVYGGRINGLAGLTAGEVYFLSSSVAGGSTITAPTISKPMFVATSTTSAVVVNYRGLTGGGGGSGSTNLWIGAAEFIPRTTNGCGVNSLETATNKVNYDVLEFDPAAVEYAQASRVMPNNWNGGTFTAKFFWTAASGSGAVVWRISARAYANDDAIDQAQGTAQSVTDTLTAANDVDISDATPAVTMGGTPANGNLVIFEINRFATDGGDTLATDARFIGVEITYN